MIELLEQDPEGGHDDLRQYFNFLSEEKMLVAPLGDDSLDIVSSRGNGIFYLRTWMSMAASIIVVWRILEGVAGIGGRVEVGSTPGSAEGIVSKATGCATSKVHVHELD